MSNGTIWTSGSCAGSSSANFSAVIPDSTNTQAGTFTVTGNTWDFSGATAFKFKVGAASTITNAGTTGQIPISNGDGTFTVADPFVSGPVAHGSLATSTNPVLTGGYASAAVPAAVGADGDSVRLWLLRTGLQPMTLAASDGTLGLGQSNPLTVNISKANGSELVGQQTMAASLPVVMASNQSAFPVTMTSTTITGTVGVTQSTNPWVVSVPTWAGGTLGAMANYGTSPGAVLVPGMNAFITNVPHVIADSGSTTVVTGTVGVRNQDGAGNALTSNSNTYTAKFALDANILGLDGALFSATNALFGQVTDGAAAMGTMANFGTSPTAVKSLNTNASLFIGTTVADGNSGTKGAGTQRMVLATDQLALPTWGQGATGTAVPSGAEYNGVNSSGNLTGMIVCDKYAKDRTSTADVQLIANSGTTTEYICGVRITGESSTASDVNIRYADSTSCTTNPVDMTPPTTIQVGATPSGLPGIVEWSPIWGGLKSAATGKQVCVHRSAAQITEVEILYTQF